MKFQVFVRAEYFVNVEADSAEEAMDLAEEAAEGDDNVACCTWVAESAEEVS